MKKRRFRMISALAAALCMCMPVYAAVSNTPKQQAGGDYAWFSDVMVYSGVVGFTGAKDNNTNRAVVRLDKVIGKNANVRFAVATYSGVSGGQVSDTAYISRGGTVSFDDAANHPGEAVKVGFYKSGFNGSYALKGRFYYNGLKK